jgi:hypothetical protein
VIVLKGLSHDMDLAFDDIYVWLVLGLNREGGHFFNFLGAPMIYIAKSVFRAVNASLRWLIVASYFCHSC